MARWLSLTNLRFGIRQRRVQIQVQAATTSPTPPRSMSSSSDDMHNRGPTCYGRACIKELTAAVKMSWQNPHTHNPPPKTNTKQTPKSRNVRIWDGQAMQLVHEKIPRSTTKVYKTQQPDRSVLHFAEPSREMAGKKSHRVGKETTKQPYHSVLDITLKVNDVVVELPHVHHINVWGCGRCARQGGCFIDKLLCVLRPLGNDNAG